MAVTATVTQVDLVTTDPTRPPGHSGWNNPYGDPHYIEDVDWYRRYQLVATPGAGEAVNIVNWELLDGILLPVRTTTQINLLADKSVGVLINNTTTWTVWAYTGVDVAGSAYRDTRTPCLVTLRANGSRVQVLLGPQRKTTDPAVTWTIGMFLPGAGKVPTDQKTQSVQNRDPYAQPTTVTVSGTATITSPTQTTTLTATVAPAGAVQSVTWTSSDTTKATVASATALTATVTAKGGAACNGTTVIKAVAAGNAAIQSTGTTVTMSGFSGALLMAPGGQSVEEEVVEEPVEEAVEEVEEAVEEAPVVEEAKVVEKPAAKKGKK